MVKDVWHFSFTVSDLDAAVAFYEQILGCICVRRQEQDNAYTRRLVGHPDAVLRVAQIRIGDGATVSGHHLELVQYVSPGSPAAVVTEPDVADPGCPHLAFLVEDLAAEYERLVQAGVVFFSAPNLITEGVNAGGTAVYFRGPDSTVHELVQAPPRTKI